MRAKTIILLVVFAAGFAVLSIAFQASQFPKILPHPDPGGKVTELQRVYLDRHTELTKWLIALGYGMLAGLVTKRVTDPANPRLNSFPCSLGATFLVLSLYAGFLSHQSILILVSDRPMSFMGSALTAYPLAAQMILIAMATALLTYALLDPHAGGGKQEVKAP